MIRLTFTLLLALSLAVYFCARPPATFTNPVARTLSHAVRSGVSDLLRFTADELDKGNIEQ